MNRVERFRAVINGQPVDRRPRREWAMGWDETTARWRREELPRELKFGQVFDIAQHFCLDPYQQFWFSTTDPTIEATQHHVEGFVNSMDDCLRIRPQSFPDHSRAIPGQIIGEVLRNGEVFPPRSCSTADRQVSKPRPHGDRLVSWTQLP